MNYLMVGSIMGLIVVVLGAFGAHGLKEILSEYEKSIYNKAVLYQMFHTIAILLVGMLNRIDSSLELFMPGFCFFIGIIIFSGSLFIIAITGIKSFGMITPLGGLFFIFGWITLIIKTI